MEDFESATAATIGSTLISKDAAGDVGLTENDSTYGKYATFLNAHEKGSDRSAYLSLASPEDSSYVIEFDAALKITFNKKRYSQLAVLYNTVTTNNALNADYLFSLACGAESWSGNSTSMFVNSIAKSTENNDLIAGDDGSLTIGDKGTYTWYHYKLTIIKGESTTAVNAEVTQGTVSKFSKKGLTLPSGATSAAKVLYFDGAGYGPAGGGGVHLDNVCVRDLTVAEEEALEN